MIKLFFFFKLLKDRVPCPSHLVSSLQRVWKELDKKLRFKLMKYLLRDFSVDSKMEDRAESGTEVSGPAPECRKDEMRNRNTGSDFSYSHVWDNMCNSVQAAVSAQVRVCDERNLCCRKI